MRTVLRSLIHSAAVAAVGLAAANVFAASIGLNFTGANQVPSTDYPPDTMGAVGPNHIVELLNNYYTVYDKATGQQIQRMSIEDFWKNSLSQGEGARGVGGAGDPRIVYDPQAARWYATSQDYTYDTQGRRLTFVGVSDATDPTSSATGGWKAFTFDGNPGDLVRHEDFPSLGFDGEGIYITERLLNINTNPPHWDFMAVSIPKADLLGSSPTVANRTLFDFSQADAVLQGALPSLQPVIDAGSHAGGTSLFSINATLGLKRWELENSGVQTPGQATLSAAVQIPIEPFLAPPDGRQPHNAPPLTNMDKVFHPTGNPYDVSDFTSALIREGESIWGALSVDVGGRSGVRWYEFDANSGNVRQSGTITDPQLDLLVPSIAVNSFGDAVIGFTATGENKFPSAYAVVGSTVAGTTTFGNLMELKAGAGTYNHFDPVRQRNRWGDYSQTVVDPSDPHSFWTFQEFTPAKDQWAVQISQIVVRGPVTRTEIVGPTASYSVQDTDIDGVFDNLGDTAFAATGIAAVGEADTILSNQVDRLVTKFPLPSEAGLAGRLESAKLRFFLQRIQGHPAGPLSLLHSTSDNDLDQLASDFEDATYVDTQLDLMQPTSAANAYYEMNVTDLVRADYASDGANPLSAFRLQISELTFLEDNISNYYLLMAGAGSTNPPRLVLTFIPVPEPPTSILAAMALLGLIGYRMGRRTK